MALEVKITGTASENALSLLLEDITGVYNASTNTTGWGSPNATIAQATVATVTITMPGSSLNAGGSSYIINVYPTLPNTSETTYTVENTSLGLASTDKLPDGIYLLAYSVTANAVVYTNSCYILIYKQVECCLQDLLAEIDPDCGCSDGEAPIIYNAWVDFEGMKAAACCGKRTKAIDILQYLQRICANSACNEC